MKFRDDEPFVIKDRPNTGRVTGGETSPKPTTPKPSAAPPSTQRSAPPPNQTTGNKEKA